MMDSQRIERVKALTGWHDDWKGIRVGVLGLGMTGFSVADTLCELGCDITVITQEPGTDYEKILGVLGVPCVHGDSPEEQRDLLEKVQPDLVVVSPGYPDGHAAVEWAESAGVVLWTDIDLAWLLRDKSCSQADWICITGTNGKTTTTQLVAHILNTAGFRAVAAGNIGIPILDVIREPQGYEKIVVELSSFQLARMGKIYPIASACLNISEDHLTWHKSFEDYWNAKAKVFNNTSAACVYNRADKETLRMVEEADVVEGARAVSFGLDAPSTSSVGFVDGLLLDRSLHLNRGRNALEICTFHDLEARALSSPAMIQNILAATALSRFAGATIQEVTRGVLSFVPDRHRNERVCRVNGVQWINDSKATNKHASATALRCYDSVIWIVGGDTKGVDISHMIRDFSEELRVVIVIGTNSTQLAEAFDKAQEIDEIPQVAVIDCLPGSTRENAEEMMARAVYLAKEISREGTTVLFSPAAASTDQFSGYAERGDCFIRAVYKELGLSGTFKPESRPWQGDDD